VKIALDENLPIGLVQVFQELANKGLIPAVELVSAGAYRPSSERGDEGWIPRFAADGGNIVISGDGRMRARRHEAIALSSAKLIVFFFEGSWGKKNIFVKTAMLLNWWPKIIETIGKSEPGQCWEIPFQWNWKEMRDVTPPSLELTPRSTARRRRKKHRNAPQTEA
jgi:hypothetical protein